MAASKGKAVKKKKLSASQAGAVAARAVGPAARGIELIQKALKKQAKKKKKKKK